jgi:hypothetical protein
MEGDGAEATFTVSSGGAGPSAPPMQARLAVICAALEIL